MLQFSYACSITKERMKIFVGDDVFNNDELVASQLMKFIRGPSGKLIHILGVNMKKYYCL